MICDLVGNALNGCSSVPAWSDVKFFYCGLLSFTIGLRLDNPLSIFLVVLNMKGINIMKRIAIVDGEGALKW